MFLTIILPIALICLVFALPAISRWLQVQAVKSSTRLEEIEEFHAEAMKFLKATDAEAHARSRELVKFLAEKMMDGSRLVRLLIIARHQNGDDRGDGESEFSQEFETLPEEARHALARVMGSALIVSSLNSVLLGGIYLSVISLLLSANEEVAEPKQIVHRFKKAGALPLGKNPTTC